MLGLAWNPAKHHVLASCSADRTVKLWDTAQQACITTYTHHSDKVNSLAWHPSEPALLLSGGFDRAACIVDVRVAAVAGEGDGGGAAAAVPRWALDADTEVVCWNPHQPHHFYVSTDTVRRPPNELLCPLLPAAPPRLHLRSHHLIAAGQTRTPLMIDPSRPCRHRSLCLRVAVAVAVALRGSSTVRVAAPCRGR